MESSPPSQPQAASARTDAQDLNARIARIEKTIEEQNALLQSVYALTRKTGRYILWGRIMSFVYLLLIVAPIILAALYLPPLIRQYIGTYQDFFDLNGSIQGRGGMIQNLEDQLKLFENAK